MIDLILNQNPWWRDKNLIHHDPRLRELELRPFRFRPSVLDEFPLNVPGVYTLRGPRQIGKTTALKLIVKDILQHTAIAKEQVMYYSCDNIDTRQELADLLNGYFDHLRPLGLIDRTIYLLIIVEINEFQNDRWSIMEK